MDRYLTVLGTASQAPTRYRNHNGYLVRWDTEAFLFDPGEGTQRQCIRAGVSLPSITAVAITHFHGDHCLGLPGVLQRLSLDRVSRPVDVYYPAAGQVYFERLRHASIYDEYTPLALHALAGDRYSHQRESLRVVALPLAHRVPSWGYRLEEPDGVRMLPERLAELGVEGPAVGRLRAEGSVDVSGRTIRLAEASKPRRGQKAALVMDTRLCENAFELARDVDVLICESTFTDAEADLATASGHLTATQAARIADEAGARLLVLTHFSQRHPDVEVYLDEARQRFADTVAAHDLERIPFPARDA